MARGGHGLLKFHPGSRAHPDLPFYALRVATTEIAISGVAHPQGGQPEAVFYPFAHPKPYAYIFTDTQCDYPAGFNKSICPPDIIWLKK
jgi:hypothetical protein